MLPAIEEGFGEPALLLLHSFGSSARQWTEVIAHLAPAHRCVAADMPGYGDASHLGGFTVGDMVNHVASVIRERNLRRFFVVGHSMTGKVALGYAVSHPEALRGLLLVSPSPPGPEPIEDKSRLEMLASHGNRVAAEKLLDKVAIRPLSPAVRERTIEDYIRCSPDAWSAWLESGSYEDWSTRVGKVLLPTLLVTGQSDPSLPFAIEERLTLPHLANAELLDIPGCGHLPPIEAPEELSAAFARFVSAHK